MNRWHSFSRKLINKSNQPFSSGIITEESASNHRMRLVIGRAHSIENEMVVFYWLIDPHDGIIADAKFQVYGPAFLIGACEAMCDLTVGKNSHQAMRINQEQVEKHLRDHPQKPAFDLRWMPLLQIVVQAEKNAASQCQDMVLEDVLISPIPLSEASTHIYENWKVISKPEQLKIIEDVLQQEVRPYVEMDDGGVEVIDIKESNEVIIAYQGACTSCFSSIGATLEGIQEILRNKIHPDLTVSPQLDNLQI